MAVTLVAQDAAAVMLLFDELTLPVGTVFLDLGAINLPHAAIPHFAGFMRRSYASGIEVIYAPKASFADRAAMTAALGPAVAAHPTLQQINLTGVPVPKARNTATKAAVHAEFAYLLDVARILSHIRCDCTICTRAHAVEYGRPHARRLPARAVRRIVLFAAGTFTPAQVGRICAFAENKAEWAVVAAALASHRAIGHREHAHAVDEWLRNGGFFVRAGPVA